MEKEINMDEWLSSKEVKSTIDQINLADFKNFSQIKRGLHIVAPKLTLMQNPTGYQNFFNEVEKVAKVDGIVLSFIDTGDSFTLIFK